MIVRVALYALAFLSAIGFAYGAAINLQTFSADPPASRLPGSGALGFGVLPIVGGAALLAAYRMRKTRSENWEESLLFQIPIALWIVVATFGLYATALSFEQTMIGDVGVPAIRDGQYILHSHGTIVRILTAEEYAIEEAASARVSTAFLMAFYVVALALTVACLRTPNRARAIDAPDQNAPAVPASPIDERPAPKTRPAWRV